MFFQLFEKERGHDGESVELLDQVFCDWRHGEHLNAQAGDRDVRLLIVTDERIHDALVLRHVELEKSKNDLILKKITNLKHKSNF